MNFWSWNLYQFVTIINDSCDWLISGCHIKQLNEINEEESNSMLPKMFTPINLIKKRPDIVKNKSVHNY